MFKFRGILRLGSAVLGATPILDDLQRLRDAKDANLLDTPEYKQANANIIGRLKLPSDQPQANYHLPTVPIAPTLSLPAPVNPLLDDDQPRDYGIDVRLNLALTKFTTVIENALKTNQPIQPIDNNEWKHVPAWEEAIADGVRYDVTREASREFVHETFPDTKYLYGVEGGGAVYKCTSHTNCPWKVRNRAPTKGEVGWNVQTWAYHDGLVSDTKRPIPTFCEHAVNTHIKGGMAPKKILNQLRSTYKDKPPFLNALPTREQIENRKKLFRRKEHGPYKIESVADLEEHTNAYLLPTDSTEAANFPENQLFVLPGGVFETADGMGFVVSTRRVLANVSRARKAWGPRIPGEVDGTHKLLYNGWPLLVFGTHHVYYNTKTKLIQHNFRPFIPPSILARLLYRTSQSGAAGWQN